MNQITRLSEQLGNKLKHHQIQITTIESCSGGLLASAITDIAGSSDYFNKGFVSYSNEAKQEFAGVGWQTLVDHGAVSKQTVIEMATGIVDDKAPRQIAVATSGIAGPGGGSEEKPVGTVWIAVYLQGTTVQTQRFLFTGKRNEIKNKTVEASLNMALEAIENVF